MSSRRAPSTNTNLSCSLRTSFVNFKWLNKKSNMCLLMSWFSSSKHAMTAFNTNEDLLGKLFSLQSNSMFSSNSSSWAYRLVSFLIISSLSSWADLISWKASYWSYSLTCFSSSSPKSIDYTYMIDLGGDFSISFVSLSGLSTSEYS